MCGHFVKTNWFTCSDKWIHQCVKMYWHTKYICFKIISQYSSFKHLYKHILIVLCFRNGPWKHIFFRVIMNNRIQDRPWMEYKSCSTHCLTHGRMIAFQQDMDFYEQTSTLLYIRFFIFFVKGTCRKLREFINAASYWLHPSLLNND